MNESVRDAGARRIIETIDGLETLSTHAVIRACGVGELPLVYERQETGDFLSPGLVEPIPADQITLPVVVLDAGVTVEDVPADEAEVQA